MPVPAPNRGDETKEPKAAESREPLPRSRVVSALVTLAVLLLSGGVWLTYVAVTRPLVSVPDSAELRAIDARLAQIESSIRPIADAFTSQSATSSIDLEDYAGRVDALRSLVDSTNDLPASTPGTLEIRDLVLTGGSQIVNGMTDALAALRADDASATVPAAMRIEEGLGNLADARQKLDAALGRNQPQ
jgi:hypothetical protein